MYSKLLVETKIKAIIFKSLTCLRQKWGKGEEKRHLISNCTIAENAYYMNALGKCIYIQKWENNSKGDGVKEGETRG